MTKTLQDKIQTRERATQRVDGSEGRGVHHTTELESTILRNQIVIMEALRTLLDKQAPC
jgi:hypothetical protein